MLKLPLCTEFVQVSSTNATFECPLRCDHVSFCDLSLKHPYSESSVVCLTHTENCLEGDYYNSQPLQVLRPEPRFYMYHNPISSDSRYSSKGIIAGRY